eukprot:jgi/Ulvmu1/6704/UM030_0036.1
MKIHPSRRVTHAYCRRCSVVAKAAEFRPCIDIHKGKVKQIVGGSLSDLGGASSATENFVSEKPSEYYAKLYARDRLEGGHVIMLGGDPASKAAATSALAAWPEHLQIGGGINTDNASCWLDTGAAALIVTSFVFTDGQLQQDRLNSLVRLVGKQRLVLDLSCRKKPDGAYYVVTDRWQRFSELKVDARTLGTLAESCVEFLVHGVDVEGQKLGIDEELVDLLGRYTPIPTTYAGGARTLDDLELVREVGRGNVNITVGSALDIFGGDLPYEDVLEWHRQQQ